MENQTFWILKIPEIAKRNTTKSFYNVHETSALDFDALPKKGKTRMTKRKLRRAKKVKAKHKQQEDEYIQMMKNMEKQQQEANIIHAVREVIVPDMTSFEKYERWNFKKTLKNNALVVNICVDISGNEPRKGPEKNTANMSPLVPIGPAQRTDPTAFSLSEPCYVWSNSNSLHDVTV